MALYFLLEPREQHLKWAQLIIKLYFSQLFSLSWRVTREFPKTHVGSTNQEAHLPFPCDDSEVANILPFPEKSTSA